MLRPRIMVGQLWQESHSYNPVATEREDFTVERGAELLAASSSAGSALGGAIAELERRGAAIVPGTAARARPGGPVDEAVFAEIGDELTRVARDERPDGIVLDLHGSMLTRSIEDPEGALVSRLRATVGPDVPIGVALDLHAHVTPQLVGAADVCSAYKTNPHVDVAETGARVAGLLSDVLAGELRPVTALAKVPMRLTGHGETHREPLARIHAAARELVAAAPALRDVSIFNIHSFLDVAGAGQAVVALADGDAAAAHDAARRVAQLLWDAREEFAETYPSLDEVLARLAAERAERPFVLGDRGDRVLAGAPGDGTHLLARFQSEPLRAHRAAIPLTDPEAVATAVVAGVGARFDGPVGGRLSGASPPVRVTGEVRALGDGTFAMSGDLARGSVSSMGRTAVVAAGNVTLLLTERAGLTHDPAAFTSQGVDPRDHDVVVVKSGYHFASAFAGVGTSAVVGTPGLTAYSPGCFAYRRSRPIYPEDAVALPPGQLPVWAFDHRSRPR